MADWDVAETKPLSEWDVVSSGPPPAQQGVPRPIGAPPPPPAPAAPRHSILDKVRGLVEAGIEAVSMVTGGTVGMVGGTLGGLGGAISTGEIGTQAGARRVSEVAAEGAEQGTAAMRRGLRAALLPLDNPNQASPAGQEMIEGMTGVLQQAPSMMAAPRGTVGMSPQQPLGLKPALQAAGDAARATVDRGLPEMAPRTAARVQTATDAGVPVYPHQITENPIGRATGKALSNVPFSGGGGVKRAQMENFSRGLARAIDPATDAVRLDDATFARLQDAAGERIGEIASRTDVPLETFGDMGDLARRDTPDVQGSVNSYVQDLQRIANDNGGVIPGTTLRKLRTEAQTQARAARASKGDLANALDRFVKRVDDALSERAPEADMEALVEARRQYAVSKALEPLIAKYSDGNIPPAALKRALTSTKQGKTKMAKGRAGELGDYANLGAEILKEDPISTIPERNLVYRAAIDAAAASKAAMIYPVAAAYNLMGPRIVKFLAERQMRRNAPPVEDIPAGPAPLELAPEGPVPPRPAGEAPAGPLGDLTPDWETAPGAAPARPAAEAVPAEGLVPAVDEVGGPARINPTGPPAKGAGSEIPAVPGRPDLPDTMVAGGPAEVAATEPAGAAMQGPDAAFARRQQETARLRTRSESPEVQKVLDEHERALAKRAIEQEAARKRAADAAELRRVASETADPELRDALHARAKKLEGAEPVPAGKAKETEARAKPAKEPDKPVPVGEATEVPAEVVEPAPAAAGPLDLLDVPADVRPPRTEPRIGKAGPKDKFVPGRVYRDSQGRRAIYKADGTWVEIQ